MTSFDPSTFPTDRLTFVTFHDDGSVSAYLGPVWLCNEDSRADAEREAAFVLTAYRHAACWALVEFPGLVNLLGSVCLLTGKRGAA